MFARNDVQTASFDVEMKEQTFSVLIPPIGSLPSEGDMFYGFVVATSAFLCFGFGNYIIKNRWLKAAALCMGWVFMVFAHAEIQRIISVYTASSIWHYFFLLIAEVVCLIFLFRRFSR
ncbi:hypothetical protein NM96_12905 [Neisseria mucosa]|nr:hypothetical protein NM96_12905 [Neisseria mucosa]